MDAVWLNKTKYYAESPRKHAGLYPYTCTAFTKVHGVMHPVTSQAKPYKLAKILRGEELNDS